MVADFKRLNLEKRSSKEARCQFPELCWVTVPQYHERLGHPSITAPALFISPPCPSFIHSTQTLMEQPPHTDQNMLGMSASVLMELPLTFLLPGLQSQSYRNKNWPFLSLQTRQDSKLIWGGLISWLLYICPNPPSWALPHTMYQDDWGRGGNTKVLW